MKQNRIALLLLTLSFGIFSVHAQPVDDDIAPPTAVNPNEMHQVFFGGTEISTKLDKRDAVTAAAIKFSTSTIVSLMLMASKQSDAAGWMENYIKLNKYSGDLVGYESTSTQAGNVLKDKIVITKEKNDITNVKLAKGAVLSPAEKASLQSLQQATAAQNQVKAEIQQTVTQMNKQLLKVQKLMRNNPKFVAKYIPAEALDAAGTPTSLGMDIIKNNFRTFTKSLGIAAFAFTTIELIGDSMRIIFKNERPGILPLTSTADAINDAVKEAKPAIDKAQPTLNAIFPYLSHGDAAAIPAPTPAQNN